MNPEKKSPRFTRSALSVLSPAVLLIAIQPAFADGEHRIEKLEQIEVTGHYENAVGTSDAASQGSVTAKLIENRPVLRPAEVLEFIPGVIVTQHSGDGKANQYFLRGFNLDHGTDFATTVAGVPVNMPTHAHGQGYSDLNFLIPELVERVDYFKGPYFAEEGDFSAAGGAHLHLFNSLKQGIAEVTLGSNNFRRGLLTNSGKAGEGTLLYALDLGQIDGPWKNPENLRKWSGVLRYSQGAKDNGWSVTGMGYESKWDSTDQVPLRAVQSGQVDRFGAIDPSVGGDTARYSLSFDMKRRNDSGVFQLNAYAIKSRLNLFSNFTYFLDDPVNGDQVEQTEQRRVVGLSASQSWLGKIAGIETTNKAGVQLRRDELDPVALYSTVARQRIAAVREDNVKETAGGIYFENTLHWYEKLHSIAGVRLDGYDFDVQSNLPANSGRVRDSIVSPKLSLIFGPWSKFEYFANWGRGFHSNDARGTTTSVDPRTGEAVDRVTPLVRATGAEVGMRSEILPGLQSSLALWRLKLDSELLFVGEAGSTEAGRPSSRHGIEWNNHYVVNPRLLVDFDLALSHARFTDSDSAGDRIPGAIDRVASFGISALDLGPWFGSFQLRYFGPRPLIEDNSQRSRSTTLAYLRVGYKINKDWKVALNVFNLFDRKASDIDYYYASRLPGEPAEGVNDIHFHPVEPRSFRMTVTTNF
jgi:outer membrane receptor protein involved in Fe transport